MSERGRINRAFQNATRSLEEMKGTRNPSKQQAAWEDFLLHWKRCIELLRSFSKENGMEDIRKRRFEERLGSPILNYAWEARNAEEHDILGSADAEEEGQTLTINAIDPSKVLHINRFEMHGDRIIHFDVQNGALHIEEGRLVMKPVSSPGGKSVVNPPTGVSPLEICVASMSFANEFYKEIFK